MLIFNAITGFLENAFFGQKGEGDSLLMLTN